jgi:predicted HicB family RNase H-like nuclease
MLKYKGYIGVVQFDDEAMIFHGDVIGLRRDVITFRGTTVDEIKEEFKRSIDGYLDWCRKLGEEPEKPFSGNIHVRLKPDLHAKLSVAAKMSGISLNSYINQALQHSSIDHMPDLNKAR